MNTIATEINIKSSSVGRKTADMLNSYPKYAAINNSVTENFENAIPIEKAISRGYDRLTEHYGVDMRILTKKYLHEDEV